MAKDETVVQIADDKVSGQLAALAEMSNAERVALLASLLADDSTRHALAETRPDAVDGVLLKRAQKPQAESLLDHPLVKAAIDKMAPRMKRHAAAWQSANVKYETAVKNWRAAVDNRKAAARSLGKIETRIFGQDAAVKVRVNDEDRDVRFRIAVTDDGPAITTGRGIGGAIALTQFEPGGQYCHRDGKGQIVHKMTVTVDGQFSVSLPESAAGVYKSSSAAGRACTGHKSNRGTTHWKPL